MQASREDPPAPPVTLDFILQLGCERNDPASAWRLLFFFEMPSKTLLPRRHEPSSHNTAKDNSKVGESGIQANGFTKFGNGKIFLF